jgi:SPP1 gp7 family putative phage head morphogenesis protein
VRPRAGFFKGGFTPPLRSTATDTWAKRHEEGEGVLKAALAKFFRKQARSVVERLRQHGPAAGVDGLFRPRDWDGRLKASARKLLDRLATASAAAEWQEYGPGRRRDLKADLEAQKVRPGPAARTAIESFLDQTFSQPWWAEVNDGVREDLEQALREGREAGENLDQLASRVKTALGGAGTVRAERIARTELTGALNAGADATRRELASMGLVKGKEWLALDDEATRPEHAEAHGQQVAADAPFVVGGEECQYPGDVSLSAGNRINCRCAAVTVPVSDEEAEALTAASRSSAGDLLSAWTEPEALRWLVGVLEQAACGAGPVEEKFPGGFVSDEEYR